MWKSFLTHPPTPQEDARYGKAIEEARKKGTRSSYVQGMGMGFTFGVIFLSYALAFYYGAKLERKGEISTGDILTVFFSVITAAMAIGQAAPNIATMAAGKGAAAKIFEVIARTPEIDSLSEEGVRPETIEGGLSFKDVHFSYPTRPDEPILRGLDLEVKPKETVALVGSSGCGKSTLMALVERFYDPKSGSVALDGRDLRDVNVQWLRNNIALVSQTPVLFPTSIHDNIALGKDDATQEEIERAARLANAHEFIVNFPDGYDTMVGDSGTQLSGGQVGRWEGGWGGDKAARHGTMGPWDHG